VPLAKAHIDFETHSAVDLKDIGVHKYAEHPSTGIWLFSWRLGSGQVRRWHPGDAPPDPLLEHIANGGMVVSHNAMFERILWRVLRAKYVRGWPELKREQQSCTIARALTLNLPADLERLGHVLSLSIQKDLEGKALMEKMMRPKRQIDGNTWEWHGEPENVQRLGAYCDVDVLTECGADAKLPDLTAYEQALWVLDQEINDRGVPIDLEAVIRAADVADYAKRIANKTIKQITDGAVSRVTEVDKIVKWIASRGIPCETFRKGDHADLEIKAQARGDKAVEDVIKLRAETSKTSTSKFNKWIECVCADSTLKGHYQYHGAGQTGRWAGRLGQLQNLVRVDWDKERLQLEYVIELLHAPIPIGQVYNCIDIGLGEPLVWLSKSLRGCICAEP
jgi:DNA polymerase